MAESTSSTSDRIECPACRAHFFKDLWDYNWEGREDEEIEDNCEGCSAAVTIYRQVSVTYKAKTAGIQE